MNKLLNKHSSQCAQHVTVMINYGSYGGGPVLNPSAAKLPVPASPGSVSRKLLCNAHYIDKHLCHTCIGRLWLSHHHITFHKDKSIQKWLHLLETIMTMVLCEVAI